MNSGGVLKLFILPLVFALVLYVVAYSAIEHRRNRNGPWQVTFKNDSGSAPTLQIDQPKLGLTNILVVFESEVSDATNISDTIIFDQPKQVPYPVPFGRCVFMDTTFLPGTITLQCFGHELELLPRVMILDHEERKWAPGQMLVVRPLEKPGAPR